MTAMETMASAKAVTAPAIAAAVAATTSMATAATTSDQDEWTARCS
jgi:hypothetical protein